jgi:uncharacterized membrane protein
MRKLDPYVVHHPAVVAHFEERVSDTQLRIAATITAFAGSMKFVYIDAAPFAFWMLVLEKSPWPTLTLVVSLEAIFLSQRRAPVPSTKQRFSENFVRAIRRILPPPTDRSSASRG